MKMSNAEILVTILGTENTSGTVVGRSPASLMSYVRTTDDRNGRIRVYAGKEMFVDDPFDTFGSRAFEWDSHHHQ